METSLTYSSVITIGGVDVFLGMFKSLGLARMNKIASVRIEVALVLETCSLRFQGTSFLKEDVPTGFRSIVTQ